jgi:hypothetical protein
MIPSSINLNAKKSENPSEKSKKIKGSFFRTTQLKFPARALSDPFSFHSARTLQNSGKLTAY